MPFIDGLSSGLDTTSIINQLLAIQARPITFLKQRVTAQQEQKTAFLDVSARLLALQTRAKTLAKPSFFESTAVSSSASDLLVGSGKNVASTGAFTFTPRAMARAGLSISGGYASRDSTVGAGVLTIGLGEGFVAEPTSLEALNGGAGVARGTLKITDKSGTTSTVDLTDVLDVQEVLDRINGNSAIDVEASISGDSIVLTDVSGGAGVFKVEEGGSTGTAADLGLLGSTAGTILTGGDIVGLSLATPEMALNDGLGVRRGAGDDLTFTLRDGTVVGVDIGDADTLGKIIDKINLDTDNPGTLLAKIGPDGNRIVIEDSTGVAGTLTVSSVGSFKTAEDLGIVGSVTGSAATETVSGKAIISGLNSTLLSTLKGGSGVDLSTFTIKDKTGASELFDISTAETFQDVVDIINGSSTVAIAASVNAAGNGMLIKDISGSTADSLTITEGAGSTAADLGILTPSGGIPGLEIDSGNLERQFIGARTLLSSLNQGRGVSKGKFEIVDSKGVRSIIDLRQDDDDRIGDVLEEITGSAVGVSATIGSSGSGLLLTDTAGGSIKLSVREVTGGSTAKDLNILGESVGLTPNKIDGGFTIDISFDGTEDLDALVAKINDEGRGFSASVIDTGAGPTPFRISILSRNTGSQNRLMIDSTGLSGISFAESTKARNSVLLFGDGDSAVVISDSDNTIDGLIDGLTLSISGTSKDPVTVTISRDDETLVKQVKSFVAKFNDAVKRIGELSDFRVSTETRPLLFADNTLRRIEQRMYSELLRPVSGAGEFKIASSIGINTNRNGTLTFDESKLRAALEKDPESVSKLFSTPDIGLGVRFEALLKDVNDVKEGSITRATETRDRIIEDLNKRIERDQARLASKAISLRQEFAMLEQVIAQTQSNLSRLGGLSGGVSGGGLLG